LKSDHKSPLNNTQ